MTFPMCGWGACRGLQSECILPGPLGMVHGSWETIRNLLVCAVVSGGPLVQHRSRVAKSTEFDVRGHALEGPCSKQAPGGLKASILTSAALFWRAPGQNRSRGAKRIGSDVGGLALESPWFKTSPGRPKPTILKSAALLSGVPGQNRPRGAKRIDFDVGGLALEHP